MGTGPLGTIIWPATRILIAPPWERLVNSLVLWAVVGCAFLAAWGRVSFGFVGVVFASFAALAFALHSVLAAFPRMLMPLIPVALWFVFVSVGTVVVPYLARTSETRDEAAGTIRSSARRR